MCKRYLWIFMLLQISLFVPCSSGAKEISKNVSLFSEAEEDTNIFEEWIALDKKLKSLANSAIKSVLPVIMDNMGKLNLSSQCTKESIQLIAGLKRLQEWAIKLIDSSGKMIDGFLQGKFFALGNYRECINLVATKSSSGIKKQVLFKGQYCTIRAKPNLPEKRDFLKLRNGVQQYENFTKSATDLTKLMYANAHRFRQRLFGISLGLCFPSGCTIDDVNQFVGKVAEQLMMTAEAERCEVKTEESFKTSSIISLAFYGLALFLLFMGSLLDLYSSKYNIQFKSIGLRVLTAFSLIRNFKKLINTKKSNDTFTCMHGIRFLTMAWIIISHALLLTSLSFTVTENLDDILRIGSRLGMQLLMNGFLAVDTFFCISGLLNCYIRVKAMDEKQKQGNIIFLLVHRIWRIFPVEIYCIFFLFLLQMVISGPNVHGLLQPFASNCDDRWWPNLLFIQNFMYKYEDMCLPQTWYLACDFQLFLVAFFTVELLIRRPKFGIVVNGILVLGSIMYSGISMKIYNLPPTFIFQDSDVEKISDYNKIFQKPFMHAGPYFIGVLLGYFLSKNKDIKIPKSILVMGWTLSICLGCSSVLATKPWNSGIEPTEVEAILYGSLSKIAYTLAIAWLLMCCITGNGGIVNSILSWSAWAPLSRLTFTTYLLSPLVQVAFMANSKIGFDADVLSLIWRSIGDLFFSIVAALFVSLLIEAPLLSVEKIILFKEKKENDEIMKSAHLNGAYQVEVKDAAQPPIEDKL